MSFAHLGATSAKRTTGGMLKQGSAGQEASGTAVPVPKQYSTAAVPDLVMNTKENEAKKDQRAVQVPIHSTSADSCAVCD